MNLEDRITDVFRIERDLERAGRERTSHWYASGAGDCWRKRWYMSQDVEPDSPPDGRGILAMDVGSYIHERIQAAISTYPGVEVEVPWRDEMAPYGGRADLLFSEPIPEIGVEGAPIVGEIKSVGSYKLRLARTGGPEWAHVLQAAVCAWYLRAEAVWLLYVDRDSLRTLWWRRPMDNSLARSALAEIDQVRRLHLDGRMPHRVIPGEDEAPDPDAAKPHWRCRYCAWRGRCSEDGDS